ncbi:MAG: hypothetical protein CMF61_01125 [Magnetococcales bacterium]|nr:hypothetical protein [Magnetococcales bacterium]
MQNLQKASFCLSVFVACVFALNISFLGLYEVAVLIGAVNAVLLGINYGFMSAGVNEGLAVWQMLLGFFLGMATFILSVVHIGSFTVLAVELMYMAGVAVLFCISFLTLFLQFPRRVTRYPT